VRIPRSTLWRIPCWLTIGLSILAYWRTSVAIDKLSYCTGRLVAPQPAATPTAQPPWWAYRLQTTWLILGFGSISVGTDRYESLGPDPDELSHQWAGMLGSKAESFPVSGSSSSRPWFAWSWPDQLLFFGAGTEANSRQGVDTRAFVVPIWMFAMAAAVPLIVSQRRRRIIKRRGLANHCASCGYDLSGLAAPAACPECGVTARANGHSHAAAPAQKQSPRADGPRA